MNTIKLTTIHQSCYRLLLIFVFSCGINLHAISQETQQQFAPKNLPGKGLKQHSILYTGEWDYRKTDQTIFIVRDEI